MSHGAHECFALIFLRMPLASALLPDMALELCKAGRVGRASGASLREADTSGERRKTQEVFSGRGLAAFLLGNGWAL